jgi:uncharacterized RDD family membrane protein YckC
MGRHEMTDVAAVPPAERSVDRGSAADAPIGRRAVARLVDFNLGIVLFVALVVALVVAVGAAAGPSPDGTGGMLVAIVGTFLVYLLYEVVLIGAWGRTVGKQVLGLEVIRAADGRRPGLWRAFLRNLVPTVVLVAFFPLYPLTYAAAAITADHSGLNDRLAGTRVVVRR